MASRIVSVILFILGAAVILMIPTQFTMASFSGDGYFLPVFFSVVSAALLFFGNKVGKYTTNRILGTAVFGPGFLNILMSLMNRSLTESPPSKDPNFTKFIQYYPKGLLAVGIIICVIGIILFFIKRKANTEAPKAQDQQAT
jgi:hypothetical protein